jgi:hypothetical protein
MVGLLELLAGGPLWGAGLFVLTAVKGSWAGCCGALLTAGGALALLDALGGGTSVLPGGPLGRLARHRAQRLFGVADAIGAAVVLDGGGRLPPRPPAPGSLWYRPEFLTEVVGPFVLGGQAGGAALA